MTSSVVEVGSLPGFLASAAEVGHQRQISTREFCCYGHPLVPTVHPTRGILLADEGIAPMIEALTRLGFDLETRNCCQGDPIRSRADEIPARFVFRDWEVLKKRKAGPGEVVRVCGITGRQEVHSVERGGSRLLAMLEELESVEAWDTPARFRWTWRFDPSQWFSSLWLPHYDLARLASLIELVERKVRGGLTLRPRPPFCTLGETE